MGFSVPDGHGPQASNVIQRKTTTCTRPQYSESQINAVHSHANSQSLAPRVLEQNGHEDHFG